MDDNFIWLNHVVLACLVLAVTQVTVFMVYYVRAILPLKKQIDAGESQLVAPPWKWVLFYHAAFAWTLVWVAGGVLIRTLAGVAVTWAAVGIAVGALAVAWGATKFARQYAGMLNDAATRYARSGTGNGAAAAARKKRTP